MPGPVPPKGGGTGRPDPAWVVAGIVLCSPFPPTTAPLGLGNRYTLNTQGRRLGAPGVQPGAGKGLLKEKEGGAPAPLPGAAWAAREAADQLLLSGSGWGRSHALQPHPGPPTQSPEL